jgi:hypothetical protein
MYASDEAVRGRFRDGGETLEMGGRSRAESRDGRDKDEDEEDNEDENEDEEDKTSDEIKS